MSTRSDKAAHLVAAGEQREADGVLIRHPKCVPGGLTPFPTALPPEDSTTSSTAVGGNLPLQYVGLGVRLRPKP